MFMAQSLSRSRHVAMTVTTVATLLGTFSFLAALSTPVKAAPPEYNIIDLGTVAGYPASFGLALSANGIVVGGSSRSDKQIAVEFTTTSRSVLAGLPGYINNEATGVVDGGASGSIFYVGTSSNPLTPGTTGYAPSHAFFATSSGVIDLGSLGGDISVARAISPQGAITGWSQVVPGPFGTNHAFRTNAFQPIDPATSDLGAYPADATSYGFGVNSRGQVVGTTNGHAFRTAPFGKIDASSLIGDLGGRFSTAEKINEIGDVVGYAETDGISPTDGKPIQHAFLYDATGMHDLGSLPGFESSAGLGVNDSDQVVGFVRIPGTVTSVVNHAIIWDKAHGMRDLNGLIKPKSGWLLSYAWAINYRGWITGFGTHGSQTHAYLLIPR